MKKIILLIFVFTLNIGYSQSIKAPSISYDVVCKGSDQYVDFETLGSFAPGSKFIIQLSDGSGDFSTPIDLSPEIDYVVGDDYFYGSVLIPNAILADVAYKVRVVSTDGNVTSPVSTNSFNVIDGFTVDIKVVGDKPTEFCEGDHIRLVSSQTNVLWFESSSSTPINSSPSRYLNVSTTGDYYAKYVGACDAISNTISVTTTTAPVSEILENDKDVCKSGSVTLHANSSNIFEPYYEWFETSSPTNILHSGKAGVGDEFTTTVSGTYILRTINYGGLSIGGGCSSISTPVHFTIHDFVAEIENTSPLESCTGETITLTSKEKNVDYTYEWYHDAVMLPLSGVGASSISFVCDETSSGLYTLKVISPACNEVSIPLSIKVKDAPVFTLLGNTKGCDASLISLSSSLIDLEYNYQWYKDGTAISGEDKPTYSFNISSATEGIYSLKMSYSSSCESTVDELVQLIGTPTSVIVPSPELIGCEGDVTILSANSAGNILTYQWFKDGIAMSGEVNNTLQVLVDGLYSLETISDGTCSTMSSDVDVIISPIATSVIKYSNLNDCSSVLLEVDSDLKGAD